MSADAVAVATAEALVAGRFRVWRSLLASLRTEVLLAEDEQLSRRVTLKRLRPGAPRDSADRLRREAELGRRLEHPNLVAVRELVADDEGDLLVMEYFAGDLLRSRLALRPIPLRRAVEVIGAVAAALDCVHRNGAVHGEVTSTSVLLGFGGEVKLCDFGLALQAGQDPGAPDMASGSLAYMAPERFESGPLGPEVDVYGLALVAYEVLVREKARPRLMAMAVEARREGRGVELDAARSAVAEPPPDLRDSWPLTPSATAELIRRGMSADPSRRPRSIAEFGRELSASLEPAIALDREIKADAAAQPKQPTDMPGMLAGRYRVLRSLGSGGFATVFLAEDERLGGPVAVKRPHPDSSERRLRHFEREAEIGLELDHPNLAAVRDYVRDDDGPLLVMEYLEGDHLSTLIRSGPVPIARVIEVIVAVGSALEHMHAHEVLHGDVTPRNILLQDGGPVKLIDLGLAITAADGFRYERRTGTPTFMAPERFEFDPLGPEIDVYGLAVAAFEALTGRRGRPRMASRRRDAKQGSGVEVREEMIAEPPPDLREAWPAAPTAAAELVRRGMANDPSKRPRSAGEFANELAAALRPAAR